jgi:outer membrane protein assembly factor BamB
MSATATSRAVLLPSAALALLLATAGAPMCAQEAVGWRRDGSGLYPDARPPATWSTTSHVLWSTAMPGPSGASPVPIGDRVFCCSDPDSLLCLDAATGAIRWSRPNPVVEAASADQRALIEAAERDGHRLRDRRGHVRSARDAVAALVGHHDDAGVRAKLDAILPLLEPDLAQPLRDLRDDAAVTAAVSQLDREADTLDASLAPLWPYLTDISPGVGRTFPTPFCDGRRVYAVFSTGLVSCYDLDGNRAWCRYLQTPTGHYGQTASPVLTGGTLLVQLNDLFGLDPETGEIRWRRSRKSTHGTPVAMAIGGEPMALLSYGDVVRVRDGVVLTNANPDKGLDDWYWMWWPSAIVHDDVGYFTWNRARAVHLTAAENQGVAADRIWDLAPPDRAEFHASPVYCDGRICTVSRGGELFVFNAARGDLENRRPLFGDHASEDAYGTFVAPLALAGGKLFVSSPRGRIWVLDPAHGFAEIACNDLAPQISTPAFSGNRIYVRCQSTLYCIADTP